MNVEDFHEYMVRTIFNLGEYKLKIISCSDDGDGTMWNIVNNKLVVTKWKNLCVTKNRYISDNLSILKSTV